MPSFTFKFGSLDLSAYVRVGPDEGLDPYDGDGFEDPQFLEAPVAEGELLSNVDIRNRAQAWPLFLNSASKDALHALMRSIQIERANNTALRVEWKDAGATNSTFYDVEFSRFDPQFNLRRGEKGWLAGVLRTWARPPYGHTGTERIIATGVATQGAVIVTPAGSIAGDVPALMVSDIRFNHGVPSGAALRLQGLSVLPFGWRPEIGASSMSPTFLTSGLGPATVQPYLHAVASTEYAVFTNSTERSLVAPIPTGIYGQARAIGLFRTTAATARLTPIFWNGGENEYPRGSAPLYLNGHASQMYQAIDLGSFTVPTGIATAPQIVVAMSASTGATTTIACTDILVLPEDTTILSRMADNLGRWFSASVKFDGVRRVTQMQLNASPLNVLVDMSSNVVGNYPKLTPQASQQIALFDLPSVPSTNPALGIGSFGARNFTGVVSARERFTFAR